jgi:Secreted protein acidic and rich in cysteine Ca binding region
MKMTVAATMAFCLLAAGCQSGLIGKAAEPASPARLEFVTEFKRIDASGKGHITMEEATAYYNARFTELDKNGDGFLDAQELEPLIPIMNARSGKELLFKLDRNSDNKLSKPEFQVIVNWLFQLARSQNVLTLADVEKNMPAAAPPSTKDYTKDSPAGNPAGKGR